MQGIKPSGGLKVLCLQRIIFFKIPREGNIPLDTPPEDENFSRGIFWVSRLATCVVIPFILDVRLVDAPIGVTQDFSIFLLRYLP